ncbi:MAG: type I-MYXAN CRISPR-associated protein Cas6/Cmx6 [Burkholderiales bacterium]
MAGIVDVVFSLRGETIPADHAWDLYQALVPRLEWLESDDGVGVHPIRGAHIGSGLLHLGKRGRLTLRLPQAQAAKSLALCGARLALGAGVEVGPGQIRKLLPHGTIYSYFVTTGSDDELLFGDQVMDELQAAGIACKVVCGRARQAVTGSGEIRGFSLMLHDLPPGESLRIQESGIGRARQLGCGIFVPHRSAAAVGT